MSRSPQPRLRREEISAAVSEAIASPSDRHLELQELLDYHAEKLSDEAADRVQEHLVVCRQCLDAFLDLSAFVEAPTREQDPKSPIDFEAANAWRRLSASLERPKRKPVPWTLAAALLIGILGLSLAFRQTVQLRQAREDVERLSQPAVDAAVIDLFAGSGVRGTPSNDSATFVPDGRPLTLLLHVARPPGAGGAHVELVSAEGHVLWERTARLDEQGLIALTVPLGFLAPGSYQLLVYDGANGEAPLIESFFLETGDPGD